MRLEKCKVRKLDYEEVYEIFKDNGYELLDKEYINSSTKMTCCDKDGYKFFLKLDSLKDGVAYSKFCNNNPYTDYNIDNLLRIRNCGYKRITDGISGTKQNINLVDNDGYKYRIKVTSLISSPSKLTAIGNNNYWSIYNINVYLKNRMSTDTLLSASFTNQNEKLDWKCKNGHIFHINWNNYQSKGFGCKECSIEKQMYSFDECKDLVGRRKGYKLLNMKRRENANKLNVIYYLIKHECGNKYWVTKQEFDKGVGCRPCTMKTSGIKRRQTNDKMIKIVDVATNGEYMYVESEFRLNKSNKSSRYLKIMHTKCNSEFWISYSNWKNGNRCSNCRYEDIVKVDESAWKERIEDINKHNLILIKHYYKTRENNGRRESWLTIKCSDCNEVFDRVASGWENGCLYCYNSKGEERIRKYLIDNNIKLEPQKEFSNLVGVGGRNLSYDFFLPDYNILIEYQGEFHDGTDRMTDKSYLPTQQEHDRRKRKYAKDNNIKLLEIWYWDFDNVEETLAKELNLY